MLTSETGMSLVFEDKSNKGEGAIVDRFLKIILLKIMKLAITATKHFHHRAFATFSHSTTINEKEVEKFTKLSAFWWDQNGPFRPLHLMTPLRMNYIVDQIRRHFGSVPISSLRMLDVGCGGGLVSKVR